MSTTALKITTPREEPKLFTANLEEGSTFSATITELKSGHTPGRGDIWIVVATDRTNDATKTFTISFCKDSDEGKVTAKITDSDDAVSLFFNNYSDLQNPTFQVARTGTIQYTFSSTEKTFLGSFNADIDKADRSGDTYLCMGHYDTLLVSKG
jgi:hypothetical protein